jgi:hypothetical protein
MLLKKTVTLFLKGSLLLSAVFLLAGCQKDAVPNEDAVREQLESLPLSFQENRGQVDEVVEYLVKNGSTTIFFTPDEVVYNMVQREVKDDMNDETRKGPQVPNEDEVKGYVIRQSFVDANKTPAISSSEKQQGTVNYMIGDDESKWVKGANTFGKIRYEELYEGIDLEYTGENSALKYAFIVSPETDYQQIQVKLAGVDSLEVDSAGNLVMKNSFGNVLLEKPYTFQEVKGRQKEVESQYVVLSNDTYSFQVGEYDMSLPLVIDPRLVWASFWGRNFNDEIYGIDIDDDGNVYVTGSTTSAWTGLPVNTYFDTTHNGGFDVFVTKFNPTATSPVFYFTYLGSSGTETGSGIAVNSLGQAYVTGNTDGSYPFIIGAYDTARSGVDGFISRLSADGTQLLASTFFGGQGSEFVHAIAVDGSDDVYIAGQTDSTQSSTPAFPLINSYDALANGGVDGFYAKFNDALSILAISSFIGGDGSDIVRGLDVDSTGRIYLAGESASTDFPFANAYQAVDTGGIDAFISRISSGGTGLQYSSFLGAAGLDRAYDVATVGSGGMAAITGSTTSAVFNTKNPLDSTLGSTQDGFAALFDTSSSGSLSLIYSTYVGGDAIDILRSVDIDSDENVYVIGDTTSTDYPTTSEALFTTYANAGDIVLSKLSPLGDEMLYSTYVRTSSFGATASDAGFAIVVNDEGRAYGAGYSGSNGMTSSGVIQANRTAGIDGYFFQISTVNEAPLEPVLNAPFNGANVYDTTPTVSARYNDLDTNDVGTIDFRVATGSAANCLNGSSLVSSGTSAESVSTSQILYFSTGVLGNGTYYWCAQNDDGELTSGTGYTTMGSFTITTSSEFISSTYLGGSAFEVSAGIGFDTSDNPVLVGSTGSTDYPTTVGAYQETFSGDEIVVVTKLNTALNSVLTSTYVGSVGVFSVIQAKLDDNGKVYVTGYSDSSILPAGTVLSGFDTTSDDGSGDAFLFVINEALDSVLYATYVGGEDYDHPGGVGVHPTNGRVVVTGFTSSTDFPITASAFDAVTDEDDGFITFIDTTQSGAPSLLYSSFVGGDEHYEWLYYSAMDSAGMGYAIGDTSSLDFPAITTGAFNETINSSENDAFLIKVDPTGNSTTSLVYGTFLSQPNEVMSGYSVALDGSDVVVCGQNYNEISGEQDVGVFKMNLGGNGSSDLLASTVIGGSAATDYCYDVIVDDNGDVTFSGRGGSDYPTTSGAFDETFNSASGQNLVVTKLNPDLDTILYSTFFDGDDGSGGTSSYASGLAFHSSGILYIAGGTNVPNFPAMGGLDSSLGETGTGSDMFVAKFDLPASTPPGPTVPDAIVNLSATAGDEQVTLTWSAPADNGSAITDYIVEYGATSGFPGNAAVFSDGVSSLTGATVTGLTNDTNYSFRVATVNGIGTGPYSNVDTATPTTAPVPPNDTDVAEITVDINDFLSFSIANLAAADEAAGDQPFGAGAQITDLTSTGTNDYAISGEFGSPIYTRLQTTTNSNDGYNVIAYASNAGGRTNTLLRTGGTPGNAADEITDSLSRLPSSQAPNEALDTGTDSGIAFRLIDASTSSIIREADEDTQWGDGDAGTALWASFPLGSGAAQVIYDTLTFSESATTAYLNWFVGIAASQRSGTYSGQVTFTASVN